MAVLVTQAQNFRAQGHVHLSLEFTPFYESGTSDDASNAIRCFAVSLAHTSS